MIGLGILLVSIVLVSGDGAAAQDTPEAPTASEEGTILGAPSGFSLEDAPEELLWVSAGTRLREQPHPHASSVAVVDVDAGLAVLTRHGAWVQVRYGTFKGWVRGEGGGEDEATEDEAALQVLLPLPPVADDRLAQARALLAANHRQISLGPYTLYTDVERDKTLQALTTVATGLAATYEDRYGLVPTAGGGETVVLFTAEKAYRAYEAAVPSIAGLETGGHAVDGMALLFVGERDVDELRALLVHELTHLLTRRVLGPNPPPWLDEGLAEDLAYCQVGDEGQLQPGTLGGHSAARIWTTPLGPGRQRTVRSIQVSGARAHLSALVSSWHKAERPALETLVYTPWRTLVDPRSRALLYPLSAFFVRFLLDPHEPARTVAFRAFLSALAAGQEGDPETLLARLDTTWPALEKDFGQWLTRTAGRAGLRARPGGGNK